MRSVIAEELDKDPDGSRYHVIPRMAARLRDSGVALDCSDAEYVDRYGEAAFRAVAGASECPGATALLGRLGRLCPVIVVSATPHESLGSLLEERGWLAHLHAYFGFPHHKRDVFIGLIERLAILPQRLVVVGDGISDREAALAAGCSFIPVRAPEELLGVATLVGAGP